MRIDRIFDPGGAEQPFDPLGVPAAGIAKIIRRSGRAGGYFGADRRLAVENAERIAVQPVAAGGAKRVYVLFEVSDKRLAEARTAIAAAHRIDMQADGSQPQRRKHPVSERYRLGVRRGQGRSEQLGSELEKLTGASRLGLFVTEKVCNVIQLQRHRSGAQSVFDNAAGDARRALRTERKRSSVAVGKGVHLLLNDVRGVADAAVEQLGLLKGGEAYLPEPVIAAYAAYNALDILP